ncbi:MAG: response regulator transcription factor [Actinomycetota bacterium]|nr:response regulator transcription factor [Actinomycetota bacterium]
MSKVLCVLLAEPDAPTRVGIRLALESAGIEICGEPEDAGATIEIAAREEPDLCLIDEGLPGGALVAIDAIYRRRPATKLVILIESDEPKSLFAAVRAGASGYVRKDLDPSRLPATISGVVAGEAALSRRLTFRLIESLRKRERGRSVPTTPGGSSITDRELEVLELMTEGLRTSEIALRLSISEVTVRRHVSSTMSKLGVTDRAAAIGLLTGRSRV